MYVRLHRRANSWGKNNAAVTRVRPTCQLRSRREWGNCRQEPTTPRPHMQRKQLMLLRIALTTALSAFDLDMASKALGTDNMPLAQLLGSRDFCARIAKNANSGRQGKRLCEHRASFEHNAVEVLLMMNSDWFPRAPSTKTLPTLGPKIHKYDLLWAIWSPRGLGLEHFCNWHFRSKILVKAKASTSLSQVRRSNCMSQSSP